MDTAPPRRPRHLMDPNNLQRDTINSAGITKVQTWVMSALAVTTILHLSIGLLVGAWFIDESQTVPRIGLAIIAGLFGVLAIAVGLLIHKRSVFTPWLLLGLLPTIVGIPLLLS